MRRPIRALLLTVFCAQTAVAQSLGEIAERERKKREGEKKPGPATQSFSDQDLPGSWTTWRTFERPAEGFSVQFPAAPVRSEDTIATPEGAAPRRVYRAVKDKREYNVMAIDLPPALVKRLGAEGVFDLAETQARADFHGEPYTRRSSTWQGRPARDFQLRSSMVGDDDTVFLGLDGRMVLGGARLIVQVQVLRNGPDTPDMPPDFMASLTVAGTPAPAARP
jgi:hypothetical protein